MDGKLPKKGEGKTLDESEIVSTRVVSRRSSIGMIGAGVAAVAMVRGTAHAEDGERSKGCSGRSDSDPNDPAGCGRRSCSDSDPSDPAGGGRHC